MNSFTNPRYNVTAYYRTIEAKFHGVRDLILNDSDIFWLPQDNIFTHVVATASEVTSVPAGEYPGLFIGSATVQVANVAVRAGVATIRVNVEWGEDLPIIVQATIFVMRPSE